MKNGKVSRREMMLAATLAVGASAVGTHARAGSSTPAASPAANGYGRPALLVEPNAPGAPGAIASGQRVVALTTAKEFAAGHLPGAVQIDWPALEVTNTSDESITQWTLATRETLASLGVGADPILTYDGGTLFACRLWWVLFYLGYPEARILNGGLPAWIAAGGQIMKDGGTPPSTPAPGSVIPSTPAVIRHDSLATLRDVESFIGNAGVVLVDARAKNEYVAGHIPGAVNLSYPLNAEAASPHRWKPAADLRAMYAAIGATPEKTIVPYCSTGVRSAVTFFTLWLLGYEHVALYTGSWAEWGKDPATPKRTGDRP